MAESENQIELQSEKSRIVDRLLELQNDFSDLVPSEEVNETLKDDEGRGYKVTKNWWSGLIGTLKLADSYGLFSDETKERLKLFISNYSTDNFRTRWTTKRDILRANLIISRALGELTEGGEDLKKVAIAELLLLRDGSSDEIPDFRASAVDLDNQGRDYKVRKNWWNQLFQVAEYFAEKELFSDEIKNKIKLFMSKYEGERGFASRLTTPEDIAEANELINIMLEDLKR